MINELLIYLAEASLYMTFLYVFYKRFIYELAFFEWNRIFWLVALLLSLGMPLIHIPVADLWSHSSRQLIAFNPLAGGNSLVELQLGFMADIEANKQLKYLTVSNILFVIYLSGLIRYSVELAHNLWAIQKIIAQQKQEKRNGFRLIVSEQAKPAFSFLNYLFFNDKQAELAANEIEQIFVHERAHIRQWHTVDVLIFRLIGIIFWFNPVSRLIEKTVKETHEYLADNEASKDNKTEYSRLILKLASSGKAFGLANNFAKTQLKKRIIMLNKIKLNELQKLRFVLAIPLLSLFLSGFSLIENGLKGNVSADSQLEAKYVRPLASDYQIAAHFFLNKKPNELYQNKRFRESENQAVSISHPKICYALLKNFVAVHAMAEGTVIAIDTVDNWGLKELTISIQHDSLTSIYSGLHRVLVHKNQPLKKAEVIAYTGDTRLYPSINFQLLRKGKAIDPETIFNLK